jgi:hypothetical protein
MQSFNIHYDVHRVGESYGVSYAGSISRIMDVKVHLFSLPLVVDLFEHDNEGERPAAFFKTNLAKTGVTLYDNNNCETGTLSFHRLPFIQKATFENSQCRMIFAKKPFKNIFSAYDYDSRWMVTVVKEEDTLLIDSVDGIDPFQLVLIAVAIDQKYW